MITTQEKIQKLRLIRRLLRELFPLDQVPRVTLTLNETDDWIDVNAYGLQHYSAGTELLRTFEIGEREKAVYDPEKPWCIVRGKMSEDIELTAFCQGLPTSCAIVTEYRKVPKSEIRTVETGEFVEVPETRIVCGGAK